MRHVLLIPVAAVALGGCLDSSGPSTEPGTEPIRGELALERPRAGPPDAGTTAGHGARAAPTVTTRASRFVLRGSVDPPASEVRLLDHATREQSAVARRHGAAFAFAIVHLRPGVNRHVVEATHPGRRPWRQTVRIIRAGGREAVPRSVIVPRRDLSPGQAELRLDGRHLLAVAVGRDSGGLARIRVSADLRLRCQAGDGRTIETKLVRHDPPPQAGHVRVVPGTRVPGQLRRRSDLRAWARRRCADAGGDVAGVAGVVWAEATNAHGLDRYSATARLGP